jgi:integrase/recombinase XerD
MSHPPVAVSEPALQTLADYRAFLLVQRRLAPLTVKSRSDVIRRFLAHLEGHGKLAVGSVTVSDVHGFVMVEAGRLRRGAIAATLEAVRCFLRFLFATGASRIDLSGTLPPITTRAHHDLPRPVDASVVRALLDSCDRRGPIGLRDFAILTVMVRLGLRANEIAAMRLDDLDWRAGELLVHSKGGSLDRMPLPVDVGEALVAYLRSGRPVTDCRAVFLRGLAPAGPLSRNGVVFVPRTASARAGVPVIGAHRLRATAASQMLRAGASLAEVGQVLRHHRAQTTAIYASVEPGTLTEVVRAWPGSAK